MGSRLDARLLLPIALFACLVHAESLDLWFVATDTLPLIETSRVSNPAAIGTLFTQPLMAGSDFASMALFYRPVASLTYAIDHALWGLDPFGYHLTNVVLHAVGTVLVVVTITEITDRPRVGYLTGLLFTVHPVTVEVVPVIARRQDILLAIFVLGTISLFVRWHRRWQRHRRQNREWTLRPYRPLIAALVAYTLALGSKETALVVPALLLVWATLQQDEGPMQRLRAGLTAMGSFAVVTLLYAAVRVAVLGGLGGYHSPFGGLPSYTLENVLLTAGKYVLWTVLPVQFNAAGTDATTLSVGLVFVGVVALGVVGFVVLAGRGWFTRGRHTVWRTITAIGCLVSLAAIPYVLGVGAETPTRLDPPALVEIVVPILFVGGCGAAILTAMLSREPLTAATRRQLLFFGCWFVGPLAGLLFAKQILLQPLSFGFGIRNAYSVLVPVLAGFSLLVIGCVNRFHTHLEHTPTIGDRTGNLTAVSVLLVVLVSMGAASPALSTDRGWEAAGELNQRSLDAVSDDLADTPNATVVYLVDYPNKFDARNASGRNAHSVTPLLSYSIEAWLSLDRSSPSTQVRLVRPRAVESVPPQLSSATQARDDVVVVRVTDDERS